MTKRLKKLKV